MSTFVHDRDRDLTITVINLNCTISRGTTIWRSIDKMEIRKQSWAAVRTIAISLPISRCKIAKGCKHVRYPCLYRFQTFNVNDARFVRANVIEINLQNQVSRRAKSVALYSPLNSIGIARRGICLLSVTQLFAFNFNTLLTAHAPLQRNELRHRGRRKFFDREMNRTIRADYSVGKCSLCSTGNVSIFSIFPRCCPRGLYGYLRTTSKSYDVRSVS